MLFPLLALLAFAAPGRTPAPLNVPCETPVLFGYEWRDEAEEWQPSNRAERRRGMRKA